MSDYEKGIHVMLDLETLGNTSNSIILSIAAVPFSFLDEIKSNMYFYEKIPVAESLYYGFKIDKSTMDFWRREDLEVFKENFNHTQESIKDVLDVFDEFIGGLKKIDTNVQLWGNSNRFDMGLLANYYQKFDREIPWNVFKEKDVRTMVGFKPEFKKNEPFVGDKHNPLDDCKHQIKYVKKTYNEIIGNK